MLLNGQELISQLASLASKLLLELLLSLSTSFGPGTLVRTLLVW
jgi:hypothetical protein